MSSKFRRHVPKNRRNTEALEKKCSTLLRLRSLRERSETIRSVKRDVSLQTGDEYFFKIYSTYVKNGKTYQKTKVDVKALRRDLVYINFELKRSENKVQKHLCEPMGTHIRYSDSPEEVSEEGAKDSTIDHKKSEEERKKWAEYMRALYKCKTEISKKIKSSH